MSLHNQNTTPSLCICGMIHLFSGSSGEDNASEHTPLLTKTRFEMHTESSSELASSVRPFGIGTFPRAWLPWRSVWSAYGPTCWCPHEKR